MKSMNDASAQALVAGDTQQRLQRNSHKYLEVIDQMAAVSQTMKIEVSDKGWLRWLRWLDSKVPS